jgi:predicted phage tail protein
VRAANASGTSPDSNEVRFNVSRRLRTPSGFTVTWSGTTATFTWASSAGDTAAADTPTSYVLEAGTAPGESNVARLNIGNRTTFTTEVTYGTYYVRVRAVNAEGDSDPTEELAVSAPGIPQAPADLSLATASGIVDLRWTAPSGGDPATGYVIEAGSAPGMSDLARLTVGNGTRFTATAPPGVYYVRVRAINARGISFPSNEIVIRR